MEYKLVIDKNAPEQIVATVHAPSSLTRQIEDLVRKFSGAEYLVGYIDKETCRLPLSQIECITVIGRRVVAIAADGVRYGLKERLRDLEERLPTYFIRINKSTLANEHCIDRFCAVFSGGVDAVFRCGYREYVSRRCMSQIKRRYEGV